MLQPTSHLRSWFMELEACGVHPVAAEGGGSGKGMLRVLDRRVGRAVWAGTGYRPCVMEG